MLVIRLQRVGRSGHAQYRVVVQDSRFSPTSGRVVAYVGNYNPHTKTAQLDAKAIKAHIKNGAQPSPRAAGLMAKAKIELPTWIKPAGEKKRSVRNPEKRRSTRPEAPAEPAEIPVEEIVEVPAEAETPTATPASEEPKPEAPIEEATEAPTEAPVEEKAGPEAPVDGESNADEPAEPNTAEPAEPANS